MSTTPADKVDGLSQADWDQVHEQIQALFRPLVDGVHQRVPEVRSQPGRTAGRACFLHSYHEILWPADDEVEEVVVGVSFAPSATGNSLCVSGDIGGGETGHTYYEIEEQTVLSTREAVLAAAQEMAGELSNQVVVVVNALRERRQPPDYRGGKLQNQ